MKRNSYLSVYIIQLVIAGVLIFLGYKIVINTQSYNWAFALISSNLETIEKFPDSTYDEKMNLKLGFKYSYCKFLKDNSPDDAIIMMPPKSVIKADKKLNTSIGSLTNKAYVSYFLYPRKVIYPEDGDKHPYWSKVTHIAVANSIGYMYKAEKPGEYRIISLKK